MARTVASAAIFLSLACSATRMGWTNALQAESGRKPLEGVFFAVMSYPINVRGREVIRSTWLKQMTELGAQYKFFIGGEGLVERFFEWESDTSDIVRLEGNWDHHDHQTFKTEATAHWVNKNVEDMRYLVKIEEDVLPVAKNLVKVIPGLPKRGLYAGHVLSNARPGWGKWKLEDEFLWALDENGLYPDYCKGSMYLLSPDAVAALAEHHNPEAGEENLFPFEDINTAMVLQHIGIHPMGLMSNHSSGTKYLLSHDLYMDSPHDVVPSLCENNDYVAYHPVSPWIVQSAHAAESVHQFTCKYFDTDHSRFWRERNQTYDYYVIGNWFDPERFVFQPSPVASLHAEQQPKRLSEETTAVVLVVHALDTISRVNLRRWQEMSERSKFGVKVLYDADNLNPVNLADLVGGNVELISMTREEQMEIYPWSAYRTFSGLYAAPSKPAEISWMVSDASKKYEHAWFVEGDVIITGDYAEFFRNFVDEPADFMSPHLVANSPGYPNTFWGFWGSCDLATGATHSHSLISIHRVSRSFAKDIFDYLQSERGGHHEYVFPQLCTMNPLCTMKQVSSEHTAYYRFRPPVTIDYVEENMVPNAIYHPIKTAEEIEAIKMREARKVAQEEAEREARQKAEETQA